ncbi:hypothetical protein [Sinorhizobium psoraleae]|uniref:Uncharacterized protein n=1 Tax=Sinorhizobium psoraleae TaxID=520838 RepID=A0ABT4KNZ0_9HYPH|nr:hypothetical protein [Sinorhizobium psoraleae]MCZ4093568.1 hypothetical protein [Sinorhizobium psoraleae]
MLQTYVQSPNGLTRAAAQRQREVGPSTVVARAERKSDAPQGASEARKKLRPNMEVRHQIRDQLTRRVIGGSVVASCFVMAVPSFAAADDVRFSSDDGNFVVLGGIGLANIKAQEFVYPAAGRAQTRVG